MKKYKTVDGDIKVGDYFIAFGVIGRCTEVDNKYSESVGYNSKETKWTSAEHCNKIEFIN